MRQKALPGWMGWQRGGCRMLALALLIACTATTLRAELMLLRIRDAASRGAERHVVEQQEEQWQAALLGNNQQALAAMLADSYIGIGPDGTISNKGEELAARADGQQHVEHLRVLDRRIRIYGTTAVVTSKVDLQGDYSGQPLLGEYRYTRVWSLEHGTWRIVSFEASRVHDDSARSH